MFNDRIFKIYISFFEKLYRHFILQYVRARKDNDQIEN